MELLTKLAPTQTLLILKPASTVNDLIKYTLMDLLLQDKLKLMNFELNPVQGSGRLGFARVAIGKNFQQEEAKLHEMVFLFPFYRMPAKTIVMLHLLQMGMQAAKNEAHFKWKLLLEEEPMKEFFGKSFWQKTFGGMSLTKKGKEAQQEIIRIFNLLDKELPAQLRENREKAMLSLHGIRGNILLLNSFKFDLIRMIGRELGVIDEEIEVR